MHRNPHRTATDKFGKFHREREREREKGCLPSWKVRNSHHRRFVPDAAWHTWNTNARVVGRLRPEEFPSSIRETRKGTARAPRDRYSFVPLCLACRYLSSSTFSSAPSLLEFQYSSFNRKKRSTRYHSNSSS